MTSLTRRTLATLSLALAASTALHILPAAAYPSYYPSDYDKMIEASKAEQGVLVYATSAR